MTEDYYYLGYIAKIHGVAGGVQCIFDVSHPDEYKNLESVFVEIDQKPVPFFIDRIQIDAKGKAHLQFEHIRTTEEAKMLVGHKLWRPLATLPPLSGIHFYYYEIGGYSVIDEVEGALGIAREVLEMPAQDLLAVEDSEGLEYLIPLTEGAVKQLDRKNKVITVSSPPGLISLYRNLKTD
jgi:16S rRNA processing protein RimM